MLSCQYDLTSTGYDSDWDSGLSDPRIVLRGAGFILDSRNTVVMSSLIWT